MSDADRAAWLRDAGWGVCIHWLADLPSQAAPADISADEWNRRVDAFDVAGLAQQLASVGAGWLLFTVGQNSGFYASPNAAYDRLTGIRPSKCSRRDLVADLADALTARGIRLLAYATSGAPGNEPQAIERLDWRWGFAEPWPAFGGRETGERLAEFQIRWEAVLREWSERWGRKVSGWWIDGVYFADAMYRHAAPPNFASFAAALRAGNPETIVAFNPGAFVPVAAQSGEEDYTAGEIDLALPVGQWRDGSRITLDGRVEHAQCHVLTYLGEFWGRGQARFPDEMVAAYTRFVTGRGGAVTWDVPPEPRGGLPEAFLRQLAAIGRARDVKRF